ncbi:hypothetical protein ACQP2K_33790 [Microbispora siamensis]
MVRHLGSNPLAHMTGHLGRPALTVLTIAVATLTAHTGHAKATALPQDVRASTADGGSRNGNGASIRMGKGSFLGLGDQINYGRIHQYSASLGEGSSRNEAHCD